MDRVVTSGDTAVLLDPASRWTSTHSNPEEHSSEPHHTGPEQVWVAVIFFWEIIYWTHTNPICLEPYRAKGWWDDCQVLDPLMKKPFSHRQDGSRVSTSADEKQTSGLYPLFIWGWFKTSTMWAVKGLSPSLAIPDWWGLRTMVTLWSWNISIRQSLIVASQFSLSVKQKNINPMVAWYRTQNSFVQSS